MGQEEKENRWRNTSRRIRKRRRGRRKGVRGAGGKGGGPFKEAGLQEVKIKTVG